MRHLLSNSKGLNQKTITHSHGIRSTISSEEMSTYEMAEELESSSEDSIDEFKSDDSYYDETQDLEIACLN
jgi:hypothetical protein